MLSLELAGALLEKAGYNIHFDTKENQMIFEDPNVYGFIALFDDVPSILRSWRTAQDKFVRANTPALSRVPSKAWNIYAIFIARDECSPEDISEFLDIEEDLRGARKIARAGVRTESSLNDALAPIFPLRLSLAIDNTTAQDRLRNDPSVGSRLLQILDYDGSEASLVAFFEEAE